uniref:Uncharacterized protein n=1 Tax=Opuntia streptacantha TaxID=393608 RepID=A0A7C8YAU7_OPUST
MASFYSDAFLYRKPLSTHSTTLSCPKIRLPRRGKKRLPVVRLGTRRTQQGRRFSFGRVFRRIRLRWLRLKYSCMLKRLKQYYKSVIKDIVEGSASVEAYHRQRVLMESSSMGMAHLTFGASLPHHFHGGAALTSPKSILEQSV